MILENFLDVVELSDPGLYDALDGDGARRELEALADTTKAKPWVFIFGKAQNVIGRKSIVDKNRERRAIPLLIVQERE